jgi:hypothetical protein
MRQNLAEEREIHRENLVSLIAPHLLQATSATDVSAIESPLHRHETKLMLFVLQVLVQIQMASTHNSAVKGRTCIRRYLCLTVITIKTVCTKLAQHIDHIQQFGWKNAQT